MSEHTGKQMTGPCVKGYGFADGGFEYLVIDGKKVSCRLVAAAPDLLSSCEEFLPILKRMLESANPNGAAEESKAYQTARARVERLCAAITKATGT